MVGRVGDELPIRFRFGLRDLFPISPLPLADIYLFDGRNQLNRQAMWLRDDIRGLSGSNQRAAVDRYETLPG